MTVDVGSVVKEGKNVDRPGTFVFLEGKMYRTILLLQ